MTSTVKTRCLLFTAPMSFSPVTSPAQCHVYPHAQYKVKVSGSAITSQCLQEYGPAIQDSLQAVIPQLKLLPECMGQNLVIDSLPVEILSSSSDQVRPWLIEWWQHGMESLSTLLALCEGNPRWIPLTKGQWCGKWFNAMMSYIYI